MSDRQSDFERDMDRTHQLMATALAESVKLVAPREGLEAAQATVRAINERVAGDLRVRWVCGENTEPTPFDCTGFTKGVPVSMTRAQDGQAARRFTLAPVWENGRLLGAVEVSESPAHEGEWVRQHLADAVLLSLMTIAGMTGASFVLGWWLVAKPTRLLREKARAVGRGELATDLHLSTRDELAEVAREMNAMCRQLAQARSDTEREAAARLAAVEQLRHADRLATVGRLASGLAHELGVQVGAGLPHPVEELFAELDRTVRPAVDLADAQRSVLIAPRRDRSIEGEQGVASGVVWRHDALEGRSRRLFVHEAPSIRLEELLVAREGVPPQARFLIDE